MIDGVVRAAIEEALRFLQPGDLYHCEVNEHRIAVVALRGGLKVGGFLVACQRCELLLAVFSPSARLAFMTIHDHTKREEQPKELTDAEPS